MEPRKTADESLDKALLKSLECLREKTPYRDRFLIKEEDMLDLIAGSDKAENLADQAILNNIPAMEYEKNESEINMNMRLIYDTEKQKLFCIALKDLVKLNENNIKGLQSKVRTLPKEQKENNFVILKVNIDGKIYYELRISPLGHLKNLKANKESKTNLFDANALHQGEKNVAAAGEFYIRDGKGDENFVFLHNGKTGGLHEKNAERLQKNKKLHVKVVNGFLRKMTPAFNPAVFYDYGQADKDDPSLLTKEIARRLTLKTPMEEAASSPSPPPSPGKKSSRF